MGGLQKATRWEGPMLTDSGGYQIFSMGHGSVGDEIKGRRGAEGTAEFGERVAKEPARARTRAATALTPLRPRLGQHTQLPSLPAVCTVCTSADLGYEGVYCRCF